jgi:hypothetical protein
MGPSSVTFICLAFLLLSSVSLLLFVSAAREESFLSSDVLAATWYGVQQEGEVLIDKVRDCSFRLHTLLFPSLCILDL